MTFLDSSWTAETLHACSHLSSCRSVTGSSLSLSIIFILLLQFSLLEQPSLLSLQIDSQDHTLLLPLLSCERFPSPQALVCAQWEVQLCRAGGPPVPNTEITAMIITKSLSLGEGKDFLCFKGLCTPYRILIMLRKKVGTSPCDQGVSSRSYLTSDTFISSDIIDLICISRSFLPGKESPLMSWRLLKLLLQVVNFWLTDWFLERFHCFFLYSKYNIRIPNLHCVCSLWIWCM